MTGAKLAISFGLFCVYGGVGFFAFRLYVCFVCMGGGWGFSLYVLSEWKYPKSTRWLYLLHYRAICNFKWLLMFSMVLFNILKLPKFSICEKHRKCVQTTDFQQCISCQGILIIWQQKDLGEMCQKMKLGHILSGLCKYK